MRECGSSTTGTNAAPALRMRVNMSEIGSIKILPAGFRHTGNQTVQCGFTEGHARHPELAEEPPAAAAHRAPVDQPGWAGVTRQLRQAGVVALGLQFGAERGVFFHRLRLALVALQPCFFSHIKNYFSANGKPMSFSKSSASALVGAVVTIVMSMPCVRLILSISISGKIVWSATPTVYLPRPSNLRGEKPRKSRMRGSAVATSRSKNSYITSWRNVTRQPIGWFSRNLKLATAFLDLLMTGLRPVICDKSLAASSSAPFSSDALTPMLTTIFSSFGTWWIFTKLCFAFKAGTTSV